MGHIEDVTGGLALLNVTLLPDGGGSVPAVLGVHCTLLESTDESIGEGISLQVGTFDFHETGEEGGNTLFHVL